VSLEIGSDPPVRLCLTGYSAAPGSPPLGLLIHSAELGRDLLWALESWARTASRCLRHGVSVAELARDVRGVSGGAEGYVTCSALPPNSEGGRWYARSPLDAIAIALEHWPKESEEE
jgi:hypothetical protein